MVKWLALTSVIGTAFFAIVLVFPVIFMFAMSFDDSKNLSNPLNWLVGLFLLAVPAAALFAGIAWYRGNYSLALRIGGITLGVLLLISLIFNQFL